MSIQRPSTRIRSTADSCRPTVTALVPVFNEQETLTDVVSVLRATELVDEMMVVSDGSTDDTVSVAQAVGCKIIHLKENRGKGVAMAVGVAHTDAPILVFVDGDILNLSEYLLRRLIEPVVEDRTAMNIGVRSRGWLVNTVHRRTGPLLSGIRCLRREIFEAVPDNYMTGYRIETAMNWTCRRLGRRCSTTVLYGLTHRVKEKKLGVLEGLRSRQRMFRAVFQAYWSLRLDPPRLRREGSAPAIGTELEYTNF
ncbi:MAG: glycosyltransferase family 2 protein [Thermoanaerobaculia bacterium]